MTGRKDRIQQAFSKASGTYDGAAHIQRDAAGKVISTLTDSPLADGLNILEIGCGTGFLTKRLLDAFKHPDTRFVISDISDAMLHKARAATTDPRVTFQCLDGEQLPDNLGPFDLIISNLTIQWFTDLPGSLDRLGQHLKPAGRLLFSTLGSDSFQEWRKAHEALGLDCGIADFPEAAVLSQMLPKCGGGLVSEDHLVYRFADAFTFARSLKQTGAHVPVTGYQPLTPGAFRRLSKTIGKDFQVTYHLLLCDFIKDQG